MFDKLGAIDVGYQNWGHEGFVDFLHQINGVLALRSDHDPVWMH